MPSRKISSFVVASVLLTLCFAKALLALATFALESDLYSHVILVPFISAYLIWIFRKRLPAPSEADRSLAATFIICGLMLLATRLTLSSEEAIDVDLRGLSLTILSYILLLYAACAWFLGRPVVRSITFPLAFLLLMVPFPVSVTEWAGSLLQRGSAAVALTMFKISGTPVFASDLTFNLSDISIRVAPECSGIHSTLALLITSLLAGYLFLRSNWMRCALVLAVIPLALLRNGFRIFTIGELCVHVGPEMIHSNIHKHGGPLFFALSLIPFFLILFALVRLDRGRLSGTS